MSFMDPQSSPEGTEAVSCLSPLMKPTSVVASNDLAQIFEMVQGLINEAITLSSTRASPLLGPCGADRRNSHHEASGTYRTPALSFESDEAPNTIDSW